MRFEKNISCIQSYFSSFQSRAKCLQNAGVRFSFVIFVFLILRPKPSDAQSTCDSSVIAKISFPQDQCFQSCPVVMTCQSSVSLSKAVQIGNASFCCVCDVSNDASTFVPRLCTSTASPPLARVAPSPISIPSIAAGLCSSQNGLSQDELNSGDLTSGNGITSYARILSTFAANWNMNAWEFLEITINSTLISPPIIHTTSKPITLLNSSNSSRIYSSDPPMTTLNLSSSSNITPAIGNTSIRRLLSLDSWATSLSASEKRPLKIIPEHLAVRGPINEYVEHTRRQAGASLQAYISIGKLPDPLSSPPQYDFFSASNDVAFQLIASPQNTSFYLALMSSGVWKSTVGITRRAARVVSPGLSGSIKLPARRRYFLGMRAPAAMLVGANDSVAVGCLVLAKPLSGAGFVGTVIVNDNKLATGMDWAKQFHDWLGLFFCYHDRARQATSLLHKPSAKAFTTGHDKHNSHDWARQACAKDTCQQATWNFEVGFTGDPSDYSQGWYWTCQLLYPRLGLTAATWTLQSGGMDTSALYTATLSPEQVTPAGQGTLVLIDQRSGVGVLRIPAGSLNSDQVACQITGAQTGTQTVQDAIELKNRVMPVAATLVMTSSNSALKYFGLSAYGLASGTAYLQVDLEGRIYGADVILMLHLQGSTDGTLLASCGAATPSTSSWMGWFWGVMGLMASVLCCTACFAQHIFCLRRRRRYASNGGVLLVGAGAGGGASRAVVVTDLPPPTTMRRVGENLYQRIPDDPGYSDPVVPEADAAATAAWRAAAAASSSGGASSSAAAVAGSFSSQLVWPGPAPTVPAASSAGEAAPESGGGGEGGGGGGSGGGSSSEEGPRRAASDGNEYDHCVVCFDSERDAVLLECGHGGLCVGCASALWARDPAARHCPICRSPFAAVLRILPDLPPPPAPAPPALSPDMASCGGGVAIVRVAVVHYSAAARPGNPSLPITALRPQAEGTAAANPSSPPALEPPVVADAPVAAPAMVPYASSIAMREPADGAPAAAGPPVVPWMPLA